MLCCLLGGVRGQSGVCGAITPPVHLLGPSLCRNLRAPPLQLRCTIAGTGPTAHVAVGRAVKLSLAVAGAGHGVHGGGGQVFDVCVVAYRAGNSTDARAPPSAHCSFCAEEGTSDTSAAMAAATATLGLMVPLPCTMLRAACEDEDGADAWFDCAHMAEGEAGDDVLLHGQTMQRITVRSKRVMEDPRWVVATTDRVIAVWTGDAATGGQGVERGGVLHGAWHVCVCPAGPPPC